jgi:hypothetical protein
MFQYVNKEFDMVYLKRKFKIAQFYCAILMIILLLIGGCRPSKKSDQTRQSSLDNVFAYEKRILLDMIDMLERYRGNIMNLETPEEITAANWELVEKLERLKPEITEITTKHPDWENNPPPELKPIIQKYINANRDFQTMSIKILKNFVKEHPDDEELASSFEAINFFITKRKKEEKED